MLLYVVLGGFNFHCVAELYILYYYIIIIITELYYYVGETKIIIFPTG